MENNASKIGIESQTDKKWYKGFPTYKVWKKFMQNYNKENSQLCSHS